MDERGRALVGRFAGAPPVVTYERLDDARALGRVGRLVREKRWRFLLAADDRILFAAAIADLGYLGLGFAYALDRRTERVLASEGGLTLPALVSVGDRPWIDVESRWRGRGGRIAITSEGGHGLRLDVDFGRRLGAALRMEPSAAPSLTLVSPVAGGVINTTVKSAGLRVRGPVTVGSALFHLEALGGCDYTHGLLGRETAWRWAFGVGRDAAGRVVGFNLVTGFNGGGGGENALWVDDELRPLPTEGVEISFEGDPKTSPWTVRAGDGAIDLRFTPVGSRSEALDLKILASTYVQPMGRFDGTLAGETVTALAGVVEDHYTKW